MIIGNGLLARAFAQFFAHDPDVVVFASGVSNSTETRSVEFIRERDLLAPWLGSPSRRLVYFSSCALVHGPERDSPYLDHKRRMEREVLASPRTIVLRLPQVVGAGGNPQTLTNYINQRILLGERFQVWRHAERNLIDVNHVVRIATRMIVGDHVPTHAPINIAARRSIRMPEIVSIFERVLDKQADVDLIDAGEPLPLDAAHANRLALDLGIDLGHDYAESVIRTYYATH